jgi:NADH-quinone oxidoreductase subunit D
LFPTALADPVITTVGPYHPWLPAGLRLHLELDTGEANVLGWDPRIVEARVERGYGYVGLEQGVELAASGGGIAWEEALPLIEGLCGPCAQANTLAYVQAVEDMANLVISQRAAYLRLVLVEAERVISHLDNAADMLGALGLPEREVALRDLRERMLHALEGFTGSRLQPGLLSYGGLERNMGEKLCRDLAIEARHVERALRPHVTAIVANKPIASRLAGIGVIAADDTLEAGLRGPTARASGVPTDLRANFPSDAYEDLAATIVVQRTGDAFARLVVRLLECLDSFRMIEEALDDLPHGPIRTRGSTPLRAGTGMSRVEGPRGEIFCWVKGTPQGLIGLHLSAGSFPTLAVLPNLLRGHKLEALRLLLVSLDLCLPCAER